MRAASFVVAFAVVLPGCIENEGVDPSPGELNFPIAIALAPPAVAGEASPYLYVVNSNFDLRYNAGSVQSYDIECARELLRACAGSEECFAVPSDSACLLRDEVLIGSHAADVAVTEDGARLYLPVRSDANLTFIDVDNGMLGCSGSGSPERCDNQNRRGDETLGVDLPTDPIDLVTAPLEAFGLPPGGDLVMMAHRNGSVSLFASRFTRASDGTSIIVPQLQDTLTGLPEELSGIELDVATRTAWLPSRIEPRIARAGIALDRDSPPVLGTELGSTILFNGGTLDVRGLNTGSAARGDAVAIAFDPTNRDRIYALSRLPEALLLGDLARTTPGVLELDGVIEVGDGPSRLRIAEVSGRMFAFVSCFDSRDLYVIDLELERLAGVVRGMSGPFELEIDPVRNLIYVVDFRASVIRFVDMAPLVGCLEMGSASVDCTPEVIGAVGHPRPIEELR
jgi:hypothetical protein